MRSSHFPAWLNQLNFDRRASDRATFDPYSVLKLEKGAEPDKVKQAYHKMTRIMELYSAQRMTFARNRNMVSQPRVIGFKKHPILHAEWLYFDIEKRQKK